MGFLDKMLKDVEKGVGRAQFEADKLIKVNSLKGELERMKRDQQAVLAQIGEQIIALHEAGQITLPGLEDQIAQWQGIRAGLEEKAAELDAAQKATYEDSLQATKSEAPSVAVTSEEPAVSAPATPEPIAQKTNLCPHCGQPAPAGAAFCPECGGRIV